METTIAIATYNRADELRLTLASLMKLDAPVESYEILIVGNGCTDQTWLVANEFVRRCARVRYIEELTQGLSHARNRAVMEARHDVVAFLDDDVDVDPGWLRSLNCAYARNDCAAVGGRAYLLYPRPRPAWLSNETEGRLTKVEHGPHARPADPDELYGLNLSVQRGWIQRVGGFRTDLGRIGSCLLSSEETDLLERIKAAGGMLWYEPAAVVGHRVPPERLCRKWFLSRSFWGGRGQARRVAQPELVHALLRSGWHSMRAAARAGSAAMKCGIRSARAFDESCTTAAKLGISIGIAGRLVNAVIDRLSGTAACGGADSCCVRERKQLDVLGRLS